MENLKEEEQIKLYLQEALEMLDDMRHNLGLFEKQRYYRFRERIAKRFKHNDQYNGDVVIRKL